MECLSLLRLANFTRIVKGTFQGLASVRSIDLGGSSMTHVEDGALDTCCPKLHNIDLNSQKVTVKHTIAGCCNSGGGLCKLMDMTEAKEAERGCVGYKGNGSAFYCGPYLDFTNNCGICTCTFPDT